LKTSRLISDTQPLIDYENHQELYIGHFYAMIHYKEHGNTAMKEEHRLELKNLEPEVPKSFIKLMFQ
jgi:hypothetical protein